MVSPSTGKTVRIYPLETITRWEVSEPSVFAFWSKSSVDIEPRRIQLQSSSYTTNSILDTLTAASVQFSEMVNKVEPSKTSTDGDKSADQDSDKKKSNFVNWMQLRTRQLAPEEKQHWVPDEAVTKCSACANQFGPFLRRHHCRNCGDVYCDKCTNGRTALTADEDAPVVRVCDHCLAEVTQRLSNAKEISSRPVPPPHTHEDLAKKLQEELERTSSKRPTMSSSVGRKERSGSTTVLNCSSCGSISLVDSGTTHCPTCGVDSSRSVGNAGRDGSSRGSSWSNSGDFNKHMQEVACPICTVHLQVQVPSSGTQTVECGVCQHPFLVGAHS
ncbi:hypothetical protein KP509_16G069000 [Ceratopteris richardii]|nr:hypothetical protein KP509_16G069000 [Ceratopteris richardii]